MLATHGLPPSRLTLELTETAYLQDAESGLATLCAMRDLGIRIAIDDYGTGLSTLDYLKKIPASEIKIDQSFVKSMRVNRSDLIMVQSTIALAHSLGRTVVAEGVEDQQCLDDLRQMGCDVAQGFAIGRPMGVASWCSGCRSAHLAAPPKHLLKTRQASGRRMRRQRESLPNEHA
jgi:EAL domain-containing protein (putative c-di-GMP-specific phosphodiesterase class I)